MIGNVEAKDLHISRGMKDSNKAQQERYRAALPNLIYTTTVSTGTSTGTAIRQPLSPSLTSLWA